MTAPAPPARSKHAHIAAVSLISGSLVFAAYAGVMAAVPEPWKRADWSASSGGTSFVSTPDERSDTRWSFMAENLGTSLHTSTRIVVSAFDESRTDNLVQPGPLAKLRQEFVRFANGIVADPGVVFDQMMATPPDGAYNTGTAKSVTIAFPERRLADGVVTTLRFGMIAAAVAMLVGVYHLLVLLDEWRKRRAAARYGACVHCGYSLAGLESTARCPECGGETRG